MADRGNHPVNWLRGIALSLERLAAQGVASGAVRGATEELRAGMSEELDAQARALVADALLALSRLAEEAARSQASPLAAWSRAVGEGAVRGAVEEMRRLVPEMRPMNQELFARVRLWLDRSESEAAARTRAIQSPGDLADVAAAGAIAGAARQLSAALPALAEPAADFAARVGRGAVRGFAEELGHQARAAARIPAVRAVAAWCAAWGAALVVVRAVRRR
jgi:hypothetical protein